MADVVALTLNRSGGKVDAVIDWDNGNVDGTYFSGIAQFKEAKIYTTEYHALFTFFERSVCHSDTSELDSGITETGIYALGKFGRNWDVRDVLAQRVIETGRKLKDIDAFELVGKEPEDILEARQNDFKIARAKVTELKADVEEAFAGLRQANRALKAAPVEIKQLRARLG